MTKKLKALFLPALYVGFLVLCLIVCTSLTQGSNPLGNGLLITVVAGFWVGLYLIPSFIAGIRNAPNYLIILGINVVFGWTVIGWIAMVIWAIIDKEEKPIVVQQIIYYNNQDSKVNQPPPLPPKQ